MKGHYNQKLEGIQVVKVSQEPGRCYELDEEALKSILLREDVRCLPVVVVSVAGAFRGGKSFILDFFLRYLNASRESQLSAAWLGSEDELLEGFDWRGGGESNTKGIHLWPEPVVVTSERTGKKVAVLLMDTQGTFDMESDMGDNSTIFALSTLLSSVQIYNLRANIGEDDLQHLQLFTEYGKLVCNTEAKAFQKLLFLVRDWSSPYEHPYGYIGGEGLMNNRFQPKRNQKKQVQEVRDHIHSCFETLECFLMPHPGLMVADVQFKGRLRDIDEKFRQSLLELVPSLFDTKNLNPKTVNGNKVQARALLEYFKNYVDIFNSDEMPEPTTIFQATADASMMAILREAREHYKTKMESNIVEDQSVPKSTIQEWHDAAVAEAIALYERKKKLGSQDNIAARLTDLQKELGTRLDLYLWQNDAKLNEAVSNANKTFEEAVNAVCGERSRICLHVQDLHAIYHEAVQAALAVFDHSRTLVPQEQDTERKDLIENMGKVYEHLCTVNEQNNKSAVLGAREVYLSHMRNAIIQQGVSPDILKRQHEEALEAAKTHFHSLRNRPTEEAEDAYLDQLIRSSMEHFGQLCCVHEEQRRVLHSAQELHLTQLRELNEKITRLEHRSRRGNDCQIL